MSDETLSWRRALPVVVLAAACFALTLRVFWPGVMTWDAKYIYSYIAAGQAGEILATARQIARTERDQAHQIQAGETLRQQTAFSDFLARRAADPSYTFRQHLRRTGGAIEE